jgi:exosome complex component CSL4
LPDIAHHTIASFLPDGDKKKGNRLRISEVSPSYVKDVSDVYAFGDIIRAKVTQVHPSLQLITKDRELGVIRALCEKCRQPLIKKENYLECKNCGNKERRKIADDYGEYDLNKF